MILIAHRGNIRGAESERENNPAFVREALEKGYDAEIDVWYKEGKWQLGHDRGEYEIELEFLKQKGLWCHAKNLEAFYEMLKHEVHCFWHEADAYVLTSQGYIWTYPGGELTEKSIMLMPEWPENKGISYKKAAGICSDYIYKSKDSELVESSAKS